MRQQNWRVVAGIVSIASVAWAGLGVRAGETELEQAFRSPPAAARPWVYWWWLNSTVTREGITRDLEEMHRQGIQGVLLFNAGGGDSTPGPKFLGPEWLELYRFALREAARLEMEVSLNLCDGWVAGGPWIPAEAANKKLVWSETQVDGPGSVTLKLPQPPTVDGFYREVAVLAVQEAGPRPVQPAEVRASAAVTGYCGEMNWPPAQAADHDPETCWKIEDGLNNKRPLWVEYAYTEPLVASSVFVAGMPKGEPKACTLQASDDGQQFRTVVEFEMVAGQPHRAEFPETKAKVFRLLINSARHSEVGLAEMWLLRKGDEPMLRPGIKWWAFKSANRSFWDWPEDGPRVLEEEYPPDPTRDCGDAVNLTERLQPDGSLTWDVPAGRWSLLRFGYTLEGQRTRCSSTVIGYEADMLDSKGIETHFERCAVPLLDAAGDLVGKTLKYLHVDSYELGADIQGQQPNWSAAFLDEFRTRRGYDALPYLPAMTGRIVGDRERTDRFLWDVRMTIGDLFAERFYRRYAELAHARGVSVHAETGYGTYPHPQFDGLRVAGQLDVTMGEFWSQTNIMSQFDPFCNVIRSVASPAHVYGKRIVQAESFTSWNHFVEYPAMLKQIGDAAFCAGLNRMVFHQYTHQPNEDAPGIQYGAGTHIDRHVTWWNFADAWLIYLTRCQYLLQSGRFHADVAYFYGEGTAKYVPGKPYLEPPLPAGYNFDCVNADILLNRVRVENGQLVIPDGPAYRLLVLPTQTTMSPVVLRRIRELIAAGATVVGDPPAHAPGLSGWPRCDDELKALVAEMWGADPKESGSRPIGQGRLVWGRAPARVLEDLRCPQDFEVEGDNHGFDFIHRTIDATDVYFVANQTSAPQHVDCTFRIAARQPELWDPVSGQMRALLAYTQTEDGRMRVRLKFQDSQSFFVVFRQPLAGARPLTEQRNFPAMQRAAELNGSWTVAFDPQWGGPASVVFEHLVDWTERPEAGIQYYSGTAAYTTTFDVPGGIALDKPWGIDLGLVHDIARVRLNGQDLGVVWTAPWRVDVTGRLKPQDNELRIEVANTWVNRLVGDAKLPAEKRLCKSSIRYRPDAQLMPSGLLGPVTLRVEAAQEEEDLNVARGRPTEVSSSVESGNWTQRKLVDGQLTSGWSSSGGTDHADHAADPEWITIKLRKPTIIDRVVLHPRSDAPFAGLGFPADFTISVSDDGETWKQVVRKSGYREPRGAKPCSFAMDNIRAQYVKIEATWLRSVQGDYHFQLAEIEVFEATDK